LIRLTPQAGRESVFESPGDDEVVKQRRECPGAQSGGRPGSARACRRFSARHSADSVNMPAIPNAYFGLLLGWQGLPERVSAKSRAFLATAGREQRDRSARDQRASHRVTVRCQLECPTRDVG